MVDHLFKDRSSLKFIASKTSFVNERASLVIVVSEVVLVEANDSSRENKWQMVLQCFIIKGQRPMCYVQSLLD